MSREKAGWFGETATTSSWVSQFSLPILQPHQREVFGVPRLFEEVFGDEIDE
jgi:hypothetical protein